MHTYVLFHNIRSAHNVGSVFRTSDGAGVSKIFLSGYTPAPIDRFGRANEEIKKTSLGATLSVPYEAVDSPLKLIERMKQNDVRVVAVEQTKRAVPYTDFCPTGDTLYIFGNEIDGVEESILSLADIHIQIPMSGVKESLNVSVCAGIVLFHARSSVSI